MKKIGHNLNNSYESDQACSGSSNCTESSNECNLKYISISGQNSNAMSFQPKNLRFDQENNQIQEIIKTESSDFEGFNSENTGTTVSKKLRLCHNTELCCASESVSNSSAESHRFDSEEISNQDIRCEREIQLKPLEFLLNEHLQQIEDFSMVPCSQPTDDENALNNNSILAKTVIFNEENSCNAVDNHISRGNAQTTETIDADSQFSFNGKISTFVEPLIANKTEEVENQLLSQTDKLQILPEQETSKNRLELNHSSHEIAVQSPDLFSEWGDDETDDTDDVHLPVESLPCNNNNNNKDRIESEQCMAAEMFASVEQSVSCDGYREKKLLKRIQAALSGVLPPPSVTNLQLSLDKMLSMYKENKAHMISNESVPSTILPTSENASLFGQTHSIDEAKQLQWPKCFDIYTHGISYNRSVDSEKIELLCMKYAERNIGAETSSSFALNTISPSSAKKRAVRMKMLSQSPGNRLSHLAKRRAVFSSANLLSSSLPSSKLGQRPLVIDTRKIDRRGRLRKKTPKRFTPNKRRTPGRKTPGSERKQLFLMTGCNSLLSSRESSKRALFLSPANEKKTLNTSTTVASSSLSTTIIPPEIAVRIDKSKRCLFSPAKLSKEISANFPMPTSTGVVHNDVVRNGLNLKRRRDVENANDDNDIQSKAKIQRTTIDECNSSVFGSRSMPMLARSQSFNVGSDAIRKSFAGDKQLYLRANSEQSFQSSRSQLSNSHRMKLLWAVSTALKKKQISTTHEKFKYYAANLARIVKRLFLENETTTKSEKTSTSTILLKLAEKSVYWVLQGKSVDEVYLMEKERIEKSKSNILPKLTGYIGPDEYEQRKQKLTSCNGQWSQSLSENSCDTIGFQSQNSSQSFDQTVNSQSSLEPSKSIHKIITQSGEKSIATTIASSVLRENVDVEQRPKSGQKNVSFSGKNQKNISPYNERIIRSTTFSATKGSTSLTKPNAFTFSAANGNVLKAKRQIIFDG